jgi:hypothetical protein
VGRSSHPMGDGPLKLAGGPFLVGDQHSEQRQPILLDAHAPAPTGLGSARATLSSISFALQQRKGRNIWLGEVSGCSLSAHGLSLNILRPLQGLQERRGNVMSKCPILRVRELPTWVRVATNNHLESGRWRPFSLCRGTPPCCHTAGVYTCAAYEYLRTSDTHVRYCSSRAQIWG